MAVLDGIRGFFSKKDKTLNQLNTIMEKVDLVEGADEKLLKPLPLIGHLPSRVQMSLLLMVMVLASALFLIIAFMAFQSASRYSGMRAISTEMEMLSQRLSRGMTQAMLGSAEGFEVMENAYIRFGSNLQTLEGNTSLLIGKAKELIEIREVWDNTFRPEPGKLSIHSLIDQKNNLVSLGNRVSQANSSDALISVQTREFAQMAASKLSAREQANAALLPLYAAQMSRYTNSLLAGESYNPEWVPQLTASIDRFAKLANAFRQGDASLGVAPVNDPDMVRVLSRILENAAAYNQLREIVTLNNQGMVNARIASMAILRDSETLLDKTTQLADEYESSTNTRISTVVDILLAIVALGSLYLLVRVFNQEAVRRRLQSEKENRNNQEAILRLLNDMADLADGDLTVHAMVTEDLTGAIADSINYTIEELRTLIAEINRATEQVTRVTGQAQRISSELLAAAEHQSHEIVDTNQAVSQIVQSIQGVSGSAAESSKVANASSVCCRAGGRGGEQPDQGDERNPRADPGDGQTDQAAG